ncbi:MAG: glycosyltransferase [Candidatus Latescibacteria bacterium]|nr:glycosyltransferase [Candidatus Latescibacterota bacterium]
MDNIVCSVIIPTCNRPDQLSESLKSLELQSYPKEKMEVIVVDDGSDTSPELIISGVASRLNARLITQRNGGPAAARNTGAAQAKGQILVFTDDDCMPEPNWLENLVDASRRNPGYLIGGHTINHLGDNIFSVAHQTFMDFLHHHYNSDHEQCRFFPSNNLASPAEGYREIRGFDASYSKAAGEDRAFCHQWLGCGYGMTYASDAIVRHAHHLTAWKFWRQHYNYGRGAYHFRTQNADRQGSRMTTERGVFYLDLLIFPARQAGYSISKRLFLSALMLVTQLANTAGFFREMTRTMRYNEE